VTMTDGSNSSRIIGLHNGEFYCINADAFSDSTNSVAPEPEGPSPC
jgi:hypothetical protein